MAYLLEETLKFPKSSFKSMKYQPYEMKPNFSMYRVYEWHTYWNGAVYVSFSGGLDSTVLAYIVCQAYRKYGLDGKIPLVYVDTGTEYPEIREFVEFYTQWLREKFPELDIEKETLHPKHSFKWVCENKGFPITSKDTAGKEGAAVINKASEGTYRQCGRRILWVRMKSGKNMPVDMALHNYKKDSTGKEKIVTPDGEVVTGRILVGERGDGAGYISHFASCKKYRR